MIKMKNSENLLTCTQRTRLYYHHKEVYPMLLNEIINEVGMTKRAVKYYEEDFPTSRTPFSLIGGFVGTKKPPMMAASLQLNVDRGHTDS